MKVFQEEMKRKETEKLNWTFVVQEVINKKEKMKLMKKKIN